METTQFFSMSSGICTAVVLGILFVFTIVLAVYTYKKCKLLNVEHQNVSNDVNKLKDNLGNTDDALKETKQNLEKVENELSLKDQNWKEHQKGLLRTRHQIFIDNMSNRLLEMAEEIKLASDKGVLNEKESAVLSSQYSSAQAIIRNLSNYKL